MVMSSHSQAYNSSLHTHILCIHIHTCTLRCTPYHITIIFSYAVQAMAENTTLTHLDLYRCGIDDDGMTKLATVLHKCPLQHLNLGRNEIRSNGVECLGKWHITNVHSSSTPHAKSLHHHPCQVNGAL